MTKPKLLPVPLKEFNVRGKAKIEATYVFKLKAKDEADALHKAEEMMYDQAEDSYSEEVVDVDVKECEEVIPKETVFHMRFDRKLTAQERAMYLTLLDTMFRKKKKMIEAPVNVSITEQDKDPTA